MFQEKAVKSDRFSRCCNCPIAGSLALRQENQSDKLANDTENFSASDQPAARNLSKYHI
jgi:hypothetical protein